MTAPLKWRSQRIGPAGIFIEEHMMTETAHNIVSTFIPWPKELRLDSISQMA